MTFLVRLLELVRGKRQLLDDVRVIGLHRLQALTKCQRHSPISGRLDAVLLGAKAREQVGEACLVGPLGGGRWRYRRGGRWCLGKACRLQRGYEHKNRTIGIGRRTLHCRLYLVLQLLRGLSCLSRTDILPEVFVSQNAEMTEIEREGEIPL